MTLPAYMPDTNPTFKAKWRKAYKPVLTPVPEPDPGPEPEPAPGDDPDRMGDDGTPAGHGASYAAVDKAITETDAEEGPAGTRYAPLKLKSVKQTKKAICYESEAPAIVKVTRKGVIKALATGKTKIHVYAQNGICKTITVKVK